MLTVLINALAYANVAFSDPAKRRQACRQMTKLIDLAIPEVKRKVRPPGEDLLTMRSYRGHATYLGTLTCCNGTRDFSLGGPDVKLM